MNLNARNLSALPKTKNEHIMANVQLYAHNTQDHWNHMKSWINECITFNELQSFQTAQNLHMKRNRYENENKNKLWFWKKRCCSTIWEFALILYGTNLRIIEQHTCFNDAHFFVQQKVQNNFQYYGFDSQLL